MNYCGTGKLLSMISIYNEFFNTMKKMYGKQLVGRMLRSKSRTIININSKIDHSKKVIDKVFIVPITCRRTGLRPTRHIFEQVINQKLLYYIMTILDNQFVHILLELMMMPIKVKRRINGKMKTKNIAIMMNI